MSVQLNISRKLERNQFVNEYIVDAESDISEIPKERLVMGSSVFVIATGNAYILDGNKDWRLM